MARKSILIVGGGTAGWLTALVLHKKYNVTMVESPNVPTIGVGESTTETVMDALRQGGIDINDFVAKTNATPKYGVNFSNWVNKDYFHAFGENFLEKRFGDKLSKFLADCYRAGKDVSNLSPYTHMAKSGLHPVFGTDEEFWWDTALHWQANKVPEYLKEFLEGKITHFYDHIDKVEVDENGISQVNNYKADYYIDCTGGKRILSKALGIKWQSWTDQTPLDSAVTFSTNPKEKTYYTNAHAMNCGWEWSIPLQDKVNHGYVYSSKHCTRDEAVAEIKAKRGDVEILADVKFEPGVLETVATKNMCSIGLSAHFIEPLEATNIELTVIMAKEFDAAIQNDTIEQLNERCRQIIEEIKRFVIFHYSIPGKTGKFWEDVYQTYTDEDIIERKQIYPWHPFNWYSVAQGIEFKKELESVDIEIDYLTTEYEVYRKVAEIERMESETRGLS
jgi:tryptophan 7-halogenase